MVTSLLRRNEQQCIIVQLSIKQQSIYNDNN